MCGNVTTNQGVIRYFVMNSVLHILLSRSVDGIAHLSYKQISDMLDMSVGFVRREISRLEKSGIIHREKVKGTKGEDLPTLYVVNTYDSDVIADAVRGTFCKYVSMRTMKKCDPNFMFRGYNKQFGLIYEMCKSLKIDVDFYFLCCFNSFSASWCLSTFKTAYPPPYILTNKKKAEIRVVSFVSAINASTALQDITKATDEEIITSSYNKHKNVGYDMSITSIVSLVNAGVLSPKYALAVVGVKATESINAHLLVGIDVTQKAINDYTSTLKTVRGKQ